MASGYKSGGVDFDDLFDPDITGDGPTAAGYRSGGVLLKYAALAYGTKRANVGYRVGGVDVSNLWAAKGTASYVIDGLDGKALSANGVAVTTSGNIYATVGLQFAADGGWQVNGSTHRGGSTQPAPTSGSWVPASGGSPSDFDVQFDVTGSGGEAGITNTAPTWQSLASGQSVSLYLGPYAASDTTIRTTDRNVRIRVRRRSTGQVVSDSSISMFVRTAGFV